MAGLTSRIKLISNALILLGDRPISSLEDGTTGAILGANLFENTYLAMLQNHRWRFSVKVGTISRLSAKPNTGFEYAFSLPSDMLMVIKSDAGSYAIYGNELHTNSLTVKIDYVHRVEEDMLPAYFAKALEYNLAAQFSLPLTGSTDKGVYYKSVYDDEIRKAKFADSTQYPEVSVQDAAYVTARY